MAAADARAEVESYYLGHAGTSRSSTAWRHVERGVWAQLREAFSFANLSVEALAHVYENTLVPDAVRKARGVHGTPPEVARYALARLPLEDLALNERTVFEPFAGHAVFLVAALARLRELAPREWRGTAQHEYLKRMIVGLEVDPFALEVARLSLMLVDYPNPNGWRLIQSDAFVDDSLTQLAENASVVVGNPPFEEFESREKRTYSNLYGTGKAQEALHRIRSETVHDRTDLAEGIRGRCPLSGAEAKTG